MSHDAQLVVVGGGPVGLVAALAARRLGLDVAVVEPRPAPVDKACGEGLMPSGLAMLHALGVDPPGAAIHGIRYLDGRRSAQASFRHPGRGVRRTTLHAHLTDAAEHAGVRLHPWAADTVRHVDDGVVVPSRTGTDELRARAVIVADGLHSPQRRGLGLDAPTPGVRRRGLRRHHELTPWTDHVEVHWGEHAEAYVTPVDATTVGVAVLTARRGGFDDHLAAFPALLRRLRDAPAASEVRGAGPFLQRARRRVCGRVLLVGDAAGYVDALTGEGLSVGFAQAHAAVRAVVAGRPQEYERAWRRLMLAAGMPTGALVAATQVAPVRHHLVSLAAAHPRLFEAAVNGVASAGGPRAEQRVG